MGCTVSLHEPGIQVAAGIETYISPFFLRLTNRLLVYDRNTNLLSWFSHPSGGMPTSSGCRYELPMRGNDV